MEICTKRQSEETPSKCSIVVCVAVCVRPNILALTLQLACELADEPEALDCPVAVINAAMGDLGLVGDAASDTHTDAHTSTHTHVHARMRMHACTHTHAHAHSQVLIKARARTRLIICLMVFAPKCMEANTCGCPQLVAATPTQEPCGRLSSVKLSHAHVKPHSVQVAL